MIRSFIKSMKIRRTDIILIVVLVSLAAVAGLFFLSQRHVGGVAVVEVNGEEKIRLPLDEPYESVIGDGEHINRLRIEDGKAYISEASCPDHVCMNMGEIQYEGETIVCLPNKLVVSIDGGKTVKADAVAQ